MIFPCVIFILPSILFAYLLANPESEACWVGVDGDFPYASPTLNPYDEEYDGALRFRIWLKFGLGVNITMSLISIFLHC